MIVAAHRAATRRIGVIRSTITARARARSAALQEARLALALRRRHRLDARVEPGHPPRRLLLQQLERASVGGGRLRRPVAMGSGHAAGLPIVAEVVLGLRGAIQVDKALQAIELMNGKLTTTQLHAQNPATQPIAFQEKSAQQKRLEYNHSVANHQNLLVSDS